MAVGPQQTFIRTASYNFRRGEAIEMMREGKPSTLPLPKTRPLGVVLDEQNGKHILFICEQGVARVGEEIARSIGPVSL